MKQRILVADDDPNVLTAAALLLRSEGMEVMTVTSPLALVEAAERESFDAILMDLNYQLDTTSGREGLEVLTRLADAAPSVPVVVMTGWGTIEIAVEAMKRGAVDFIQKPWENERLLNTLSLQIRISRSEAEGRRLRQENRLLRAQLGASPVHGVIAESAAMKAVFKTAERVSRSEMNVLITGENGTGKSLLAQYLHDCSPRAERPFIAVNMGAIPEHLFESEMFGHMRGAFTDAKEDRIGRFELAAGGTLFLDEIATIPPAQQGKLLRVLEDAKYERVGSSKTRIADVRIVSATNADLESLIASGRFRQDLLYRLNTVPIPIPPLRERRADIVPLAEHFAALYAAKYQLPVPRLDAGAHAALEAHRWPGNVRELSHLIERALFTSDGASISAAALGVGAASAPAPPQEPELASPDLTLDEVEKRVLRLRLQQFNGRVVDTARSLGLSRSAFYRRLNKYQL